MKNIFFYNYFRNINDDSRNIKSVYGKSPFCLLRKQQHSVDAAIVLGVISDLRVLSPDDLSSRRHHTELGDVDLDDGTLRDDAQTRVHR